MGDLYCSIGQKTIIAELKINGQHSLHFYNNSFASEEELYHIFEDDLLKNDKVDQIHLTSPHEPAYLLRTEDVSLFQEKNNHQYLFRNYKSDESQSIVYGLPDFVKMLHPFKIPLYYYPTIELIKGKIEDKKDFTGRKHFIFAFLMENILHLFYYFKGENRVATIFDCEASSDALYYSLLVMKEQNVSVEDVEFVAAGRGTYFTEALNLWNKYVRPNNEYFDNVEGRKYFDLKALISCA